MTGPVGATNRIRRSDNWVVLLLVAAVGWTYLSGARLANRTFTARNPDSYYALLAEALLAGQTHLKLTPDPRLAQLANPYAGPQGALRPHDMSYYRGRFYLYYGITPALLVFAPMKALTGLYPTEAAATAMMCWGGFALGAWWLLRLKRRLFPDVASGWLALAVIVFGFGTPVLGLAHNTTFYAVPIAGAFFCLMAILALVTRAVTSPRAGAQAAWLASASLAAGLAVGSRPDYVLALPALLLPAALLWRGLPANLRLRWTGARCWLAAIVPAAMVGLGLALYNYLRFDDPLDFGIRYSMATGDLREARLMGPEFIRKNVELYLLHSASWLRYAPFVFSGERPVGVLVHFPFVALALAFPLTLLHRALRADRAWVTGGGLLIAASVTVFFTLCLFFGEVDRYLSDFAPAALLLGGAVLLALAPRPGESRRLVINALSVAIATFTVANGLLFALPLRGDAAHRFTLERALNLPTHWIERALGEPTGPLALDVTFPRDRTGQREPLFSSTGAGGGGDVLYLEYTDAHHVRIGFFHVGAGGPISDPIEVDYARPQHVEIWLGALLPPANHPAWGARDRETIAAVRRRLEVRIDGHVALRSAAECFFTSPDLIRIGANEIASDVSAPLFTGKINEVHRLGLEAATAGSFNPTGPVRLEVRFPSLRPADISEPILSIGETSDGDLLYVTYLPDGQIRFGLDTWNVGKVESDPVRVDLAAPHVIEVELGSLYPKTASEIPSVDEAELRSRFIVLLDGQPVIDTTRQYVAPKNARVEFAFNAVGSSAAKAMFTGTILSADSVGHPLKTNRAVGWGPVALSVRFPIGRPGVAEPLLATGRNSAADIVYVVYADDQHVRFGLDHWGKGGALSEPIKIDYAATHRLEISMGSLFPAADSGLWAAHDATKRAQRHALTEIRLDGKVVLSTDRLPAYRDRPGEARVGENLLGASSCSERFMGEIISQERLSW